MSDRKCDCSMSISILGEGCRYCQPQNHIDHISEWLDEERQQVEQLTAEVKKLKKAVSIASRCIEVERQVAEKDEAEVERLREASIKVVNQWRRRNMMGIVIDELEDALNHKEV